MNDELLNETVVIDNFDRVTEVGSAVIGDEHKMLCQTFKHITCIQVFPFCKLKSVCSPQKEPTGGAA
jgi:hypothetical protein